MSNYKTDPANVYFTANFNNSTNASALAEFTSYRNTSIINSPGEYYLRVDDFYISNVIIPLMIIGDQSLSVTIDATSTGGSSIRVYLVPPNNSNNPIYTGYIYYIQTFVKIVNDALRRAHLLSAATGNFPVFVYDGDEKFRFIISTPYVSNGTEIWFNTQLGQKLSSFELFYNSFTSNGPLEDGKVYRLIYQTGGLFYSPSGIPPFNYSLFSFQQPYPSLFLLTDVKRLVVTSNQLPILRQFYNKVGNKTDGVNQTRGVLFTVPINSPTKLLTESISFTPNQTKLIDLISQEPLNIIDIQIFYELDDGTYNPVPISPGKSFSIELAFVHKSINDNAYTFNKLDL